MLTAPGARSVALVRLLVSDDCGYDQLVAEVAAPRRGVVYVLEQASRCHEFLRGQPGWSASESQLAMVLGDVEAVTGAPLPDGLELRSVNRVAPETPDAVALKDAVAVAVASDPGIPEAAADDFTAYLSRLPSSVRLLAGVDEDGVAHAT